MKTCDYCSGDISPGDEVSAPDQIGVLHYSKISCAEVLKRRLERQTCADCGMDLRLYCENCGH